MKLANVIVVPTVLAIAAGLCIWGLVHLRRVEEFTHCTNNIKALSLALQNYHDTNRKFPLAIATHGLGREPQVKVVDLPIEKCASWLFEIDPYYWARMDPQFRININ